jgi:Zn-finger nucleic acid-binding protein
VNCPSCGAAMRLDTDREFFQCEYCRSFYFPEPNADGVRVLEEPAKLACPVCAVPLVHAAVADRRILYCTKCRGMLISMNLFLAIIQDLRAHRAIAAEAGHQPDWKDLDRHIYCPQCGQTMDTHPYGGGGGVIIDACENCSLNWLDYGELDKVVRAPDHEFASQLWGPIEPPPAR